MRATDRPVPIQPENPHDTLFSKPIRRSKRERETTGDSPVTCEKCGQHRANVVAGFEHMRRERMPQHVGRHRFGDARLFGGTLDLPLHRQLIEVMATDGARTRIVRKRCSHEHALPDPFGRRVRVLYRQRIRQKHLLTARCGAIRIEHLASLRQFPLQRLQQRLRLYVWQSGDRLQFEVELALGLGRSCWGTEVDHLTWTSPGAVGSRKCL